MHALNEEQRRSVIVQYSEDHPDQSAYQVAEYFSRLNVPKRTVYEVLQHYNERGDAARASGSGDGRRRRALISDALGPRRLSQRDLARKYEISIGYVNKILQEEGVHAYKRESVPHATESQAETQKLRIGRLYRHILAIGDGQPSIVMAGELFLSEQLCNTAESVLLLPQPRRRSRRSEVHHTAKIPAESSCLAGHQRSGHPQAFFLPVEAGNQSTRVQQGLRGEAAGTFHC
jgi:transposase